MSIVRTRSRIIPEMGAFHAVTARLYKNEVRTASASSILSPLKVQHISAVCAIIQVIFEKLHLYDARTWFQMEKRMAKAKTVAAVAAAAAAESAERMCNLLE